MIPIVEAVLFHRFMTSGRTSPALCGCEDQAGQNAGDFVIKFLGGMERGTRGLVAELVASRLASRFSIPVPVPALVVLDHTFAELVARSQPTRAERLRKSVGINFGTRLLDDVTTWPVDKAIPEAMWQTAISIFAFDALIQNPDRRFSPNPNLFTRGDRIFVFDHELAFSFLESFLPTDDPWRLERQHYLADHVFYRRLKSKQFDLGEFTATLAAFPAWWPEIVTDIPAEWNNGSLARIEDHLRAVAERSTDFVEEIRRRLA